VEMDGDLYIAPLRFARGINSTYQFPGTTLGKLEFHNPRLRGINSTYQFRVALLAELLFH